jgi:hypothetical protein
MIISFLYHRDLSHVISLLIKDSYNMIVNHVGHDRLIALMGGTYQRVHEKSKLETLRNRAKLILEYEKNMSEVQRAGEKWHPRYLHFLVLKRDVVMNDEYHTADERAEEMDAQVKSIQEKVEQMDKWKTVMDVKMDRIELKMETKMDEIKNLLLEAVDNLNASRP